MIKAIKNSLIPVDAPAAKHPNFRCAAVLMPIVKLEQSWHVLFTRRADHLKHHPGQVSFPGGSYEPGDDSLAHTALRETEEEVGIFSHQVELLGRLPQQETVSQYFITPYIGIVNSAFKITIDPNEVAEVFTSPLEFVTDQTNQIKKTGNFNGQSVSYYVIKYKHYDIWGATAKILVNLTKRLGNTTDLGGQ